MQRAILLTVLALGQVLALSATPIVQADPAEPSGCDVTGDTSLCNGLLCGAHADDSSACMTGCCSGGYCADTGSCTARNTLVSIFMITLIGGLIAMCCIGIKT